MMEAPACANECVVILYKRTSLNGAFGLIPGSVLIIQNVVLHLLAQILTMSVLNCRYQGKGEGTRERRE